jgi:hypothetical protein
MNKRKKKPISKKSKGGREGRREGGREGRKKRREGKEDERKGQEWWCTSIIQAQGETETGRSKF